MTLHYVLKTIVNIKFFIFVQLRLRPSQTRFEWRVCSSKRQPCRLGINSGRIGHKLDIIPRLSSVSWRKNFG